jgi:hypothetical protein
MMHNDNENDPLEGLIKYAGHREIVDANVSERVDRHLHTHWKQMVQQERRRRRRKRVAKISGGLAIVASVILAINILKPGYAPATIVAYVENSIGVVQSGERGEPLSLLKSGHTIHAGGILETGEESGVGLRLTSGHNLRMAASSRLRIETGKVLLDRGKIYVDSGPSGSSQAISVYSSYATVTEVGTQYQVELLDDGIEVSVREGIVRLEADGSEATASAGEALLLDGDGEIDRAKIPEYGERWQWITPLSQGIKIDGKGVGEFLLWLSRENGWRIRYSSNDLRLGAQTILLSGSIEGLGAEEALETVMIAAGWRYRLVDGEIVIGTDETRLPE